MYLLLIFLSIIGSCLAGFFGRYLGSNGSAILTTSCLFISFLLSLLAFYEVGLARCFVYIKLCTWISSEVLHVDWGFMFDSLTVSMCVVVTFISLLVHLYSTEYMSHDPHLPRFMSYLSLFTFFMLILISADNFLQMFVGWEGVGLCSYLLINFWFTRIQANKAAIKAMILNRIGDFGLLIAILLIFINYKAVDYSTVAVVTPFFKTATISFLNFKINLLNTIGLFMFIGAVGKSAQLTLHTWLPDAMEGPTPVSALIHAATMVTAGVFLITRSSFIYEHTPNILEYVVIIGVLTSFFAATTGLLQNDLKRVIAYSTCSQLGYMVFACGLSNYSAGFFHLTNHAFFKALLFLGAGSVIHAVNDEQDMRKMGGLKNLVPFTYSMIVIGSLALIGFPFLTGFYSKDLILEVAYSKYNSLGIFSYCLGTLGAFLTAFYSMRLSYLTFLSKPNGYKQVICFAYDSGPQICFALGCLAIPSILIGYLTKDMIVGIGSSFFGTAIYINLQNFNLFDAEFIDVFYKTLPVNLSLIGFFSAFLFYIFKSRFLFTLKTSIVGKKIYYFLNRKWLIDKIYAEFLGQFFFKFGYSTSYKVRLNSNWISFQKEIKKKLIYFLKALMRLRVLDFNFRNNSIQGYLILLFLSLVLFLRKTGKCKLIILFLLDNVNRNILFNKLNRQKSLSFNCESSIRFYNKYYLKDKFIKKLYGVLNTNFIFIFFNKFNINKSKFFSTNVYQLKNRFKKETQKFENIFDLVYSIKNLKEAYYEIRNKSNNLNSQNSRIKILTNLESDWFLKISNKLNLKSYKHKDTKLFNINNKKFLAIESLCEKIILQVIFQILRQIYEGVSVWKRVEYKIFASFNDFSSNGDLKRVRLKKNKKIYEIKKWILKPTFNYNFFGCSYSHSIYSTLKMIKKTWLPVTWFWSIDFVKIFDKINHERLICKIETKINDSKFIQEFRKILQNNTNKFVYKYSNKFKNNTFPLLLLNIYLSSLDNYIYKLKNKFNEKNILHSKFHKNNLVKLKKKIAIKNLSSDVILNQRVEIHYARHADNILFGFFMTKSLAKKIINKIQNFINSDLKCKELNIKLNPIYGISKSVTFLNFEISLYPFRYSYKPQHLIKFYKFKVNLQRQKISESKKYLKMQKQTLLKFHEELNHFSIINSNIFKKKVKVNWIPLHWIKTKMIRSLRNSLTNIKVKRWFNLTMLEEKNVSLNNVFALAEEKNLDIFKNVTWKWIKYAQKIANKENSSELKIASKLYFSTKFVKARNMYLKELKIISSKNFSKKIMKNIIKDVVPYKIKKEFISEINFNYHSIRILFSKKNFIKKFKIFGIIHEISFNPVRFKSLILLKDQDIINWYTFKSKCIWNYYRCSDNIWDVKKVLNWTLRYSLFSTLANKHKFSIKKCIKKYSISPNFHHFYKFNKKIKSILFVQYPTSKWINNKNKIFNSNFLTFSKLEKIFKL